MTSAQKGNAGLKMRFLMRVVRKECRYLVSTDQRLFDLPFSLDRAASLETDLELSERVDAFAGRFGRLQDTVGDKLLPLLLAALGEMPGAAIDNLDRAERLGMLESTEAWLVMRQIRNQMVHEYVEDLAVLVSALQTAHEFVPVLVTAANKLTAEIEQRGWA